MQLKAISFRCCKLQWSEMAWKENGGLRIAKKPELEAEMRVITSHGDHCT